MWLILVIFGLLFISGFSGLFPVFSCVFGVNSLIINTIHFSGMHAFSSCFCVGEGGSGYSDAWGNYVVT